MLGKLFKYDFKRGANVLLTIIISMLFFLAFSLFVISFNNNIVNSLLVFASALTSIGLFATYAIVNILNFYNTMTKNESYFTYSIPASTSKIVFSKILSAFIWGIICIFTLVFFWVILLNALNGPIPFDEGFNQILFFLGGAVIGQFIFIIILIAFSISLSVYTRFKSNNSGIIISIISYVVLSNACGIIQLVILSIILAVQGNLSKMFNNAIPDSEIFNILNSFFPSIIIVYVVFAIIFYYLTVKIFKKHKSI